jgi:hypothetical protein
MSTPPACLDGMWCVLWVAPAVFRMYRRLSGSRLIDSRLIGSYFVVNTCRELGSPNDHDGRVFDLPTPQNHPFSVRQVGLVPEYADGDGNRHPALRIQCLALCANCTLRRLAGTDRQLSCSWESHGTLAFAQKKLQSCGKKVHPKELPPGVVCLFQRESRWTSTKSS